MEGRHTVRRKHLLVNSLRTPKNGQGGGNPFQTLIRGNTMPQQTLTYGIMAGRRGGNMRQLSISPVRVSSTLAQVLREGSVYTLSAKIEKRGGFFRLRTVL